MNANRNSTSQIAVLHLLILGLGASVSGAEFTYGPWRHSAIGGGGYIQNVVLCPSDVKRAYAYVDNSGIFRSDDGGRAWRIVHGGLPAAFGIYDVRGLVVDPRNADKIIAAIGTQWDEPKGIYISDDGGETWKQTLKTCIFGGDELRNTGFILQRHPANPDEVTVATGGKGVFRSRDNGLTWENHGLEGLYTTDLKYDAAKPSRMWLCALPVKLRAGTYPKPFNGGFYGSKDGGETWLKISGESPSEIIQDPKAPAIIYGIFDETHIRRSEDGGQTWSDCSQGLQLIEDGKKAGTIDERRYTSLAAGPSFILTASCKGTFYRLDSGQSAWLKVERQEIEENYMGQPWFASHALGVQGHFGSALGSITVDPRNPLRWFCTDFYGAYQTLDGGKRWALSCDGMDATVLFCLEQDASDPAIIHLGMADNGHFLSQNGGALFDHAQMANQNTKCMSVSPAQPSRIYAMGSGLAPGLGGQISVQVYVSTDRGQTWIESPMIGLKEMGKYCACSIVADPRDPDCAYLGRSGSGSPGGGGVYRTTDTGRSWEWIGEGMPEGKWFFRPHIWNIGRELAASPDGSLVAIGDGGPCYLAPNEKRWQRAKQYPTGAPNAVVADPRHPGWFYIAAEGDGGVFRSEDGGATWKRLYKGSSRHVAVDAAKPGRIAAGLADGVIYSVDDGKTWTEADRRLPYRFQPLPAFAGERLLVGTVGNGCFWMPLSPAGEAPVSAHAATPAYKTAAANSAQLLPNGGMTDGDKIPAGWMGQSEAPKSSGVEPAPWARLSRDPQDFKVGPASLRVEGVGGAANGTVTTIIPVPAGAASGQPWMVGGWIKGSGRLEYGQLSLYFMGPVKSGNWKFVASAPLTGAWTEFNHAVQVPQGAEKARLQLSIKGEGKVWLDEVSIAAGQVWKGLPALGK